MPLWSFHIPTWRCSSLVTCDGSFQNPERHLESWILLLSAWLLCEKPWWLMIDCCYVIWKNVWLVWTARKPVLAGFNIQFARAVMFTLYAYILVYTCNIMHTYACICSVLNVVFLLDVNPVPSRFECDGQKETSYKDGDANAMHESFRSEFLFACQSRSQKGSWRARIAKFATKHWP